MSVKKPTAIVYIDGLNLYRQRITGNNHLKWLDVYALSELLYPEFEIHQVNYFSAKIRTISNDFEPAYRQLMYLARLQEEHPKIQITLGKIRMDTKYYPAHPISLTTDGQLTKVKVVKLEEKGTDLSIAANLVADAAEHKADHLILISNDSDFEPLIKLANSRFESQVRQVNPRNFSEELLEKAQFTTNIGRPRSWH